MSYCTIINYRYLLILILFTSCNSSKRVTPDDIAFSIVRATSESWTAGIKQAGSGIEYSFSLKVNDIQNLSFDSVWVNNQRLLIKVVKDAKIVIDHSQIYSGDQIIIRCSGNTNAKEIITPPLVTNEGEAIIRYILNNKQYYSTVNKITPLKSKPRQ